MVSKSYHGGTNRVLAGGTLTLLFVVYLGSPSFAQPRCKPWAAKALSVEGKVELLRAGETAWKTLARNEILCAGDSAHVAKRSRAAILLRNQTLLRLDEATTITFTKIEPNKPSWLNLLKGAVHFISRTPESLDVTTPFVNAGIEGTEFVVRVEPADAGIWVFEGQVLARNTLGTLMLSSGEAAVAKKGRAPERRLVVKPREAVQWALYYPPLIDLRREAYPPGPDRETIQATLERYRRGDLPGAFARLDRVPENRRTPRYYALRAGLLLTVGRVDEVGIDIDTALKLDPNGAAPYALQSVIAVTQNDNEKAFELAQKAVALDPRSPTAQVALSYAHQSRFDIEKARDSVEQAVNLDPENALAWARLAELELSLGYLDKARAAAQRAAELDPQLGRTQTVLGFANLTRVDIEAAKAAFDKAIALEPASPLARLGLGLAMIRQGHLDNGTQEIETAAILDVDNSLIRSYLGKAYFEQKRNRLASTEFAIAKELDPKDPTPWFYGALLKQTANRPVEALRDLQKSIVLNDNRAVYRSRLLLDQDQATRSTSLARIYDDLGFARAALAQASKSLSLDPANHSAHRFLADTYAQLPRHEIARTSELLQAQLLQPINISPVQPSLAVADLNIVAGIGPREVAFSEFTPLFERNRLHLLASGIGGNNGTWGDEIVLSGLYDQVSFSLGQLHTDTDGFRENNDIENNLYNAFAQIAVTPKLNLQVEYRRRETDHGDIDLNFDPDDFSKDDRRRLRQDTLRIGGRFSPSPQSDFITSLIYSDRKEKQKQFPVPNFSINTIGEQDGYQTEAQYSFKRDLFNLILGGGVYNIDDDTRIDYMDFKRVQTIDYRNMYLYTNTVLPKKLTWTIGLSFDEIKKIELESDKVNPKFGLQWNITDGLLLRLAAFKTLKRDLMVEQTIEPTQIAGFNQFFDDFNGTEAKQYGVGMDARLSNNFYCGVEISKRDLDVHFNQTDSPGLALSEEREEQLYRTYLYWTPQGKWVLRVAYEIEKFSREVARETGLPHQLDTMSIPLAVRYFNPNRLFAELSMTYIDQKVDRLIRTPPIDKQDDFVTIDAVIGFHLPKRRGLVSLETRNLFNEHFLYQDEKYRTSESRTPRYVPERTILGRFTLSF